MGNHAVQFDFIGLSVECNAVGAVKRGNTDPGLTDAQIERSAVLERVMEVIRTVGACPIDLNIFAAGEEIAAAGACHLHCLTSVAVYRLGGNVQNDNIGKVDRAVVSAVDIFITADECVVAVLVSAVLEFGAVSGIVNGKIGRGLAALGNSIGAEAEAVASVVAVGMLQLVVVLCKAKP